MSKRPAPDPPSKQTFGDKPTLWQDIKTLDPEIMGPIAAHLTKKYDDGSISFARRFQGGWEVWLQIELATVLLVQLARQVNIKDNGYIVERETTVWNKSGRGNSDGKCDIWIQPNLDHSQKPTGRPACVMELKVDYAYFTGEHYKYGQKKDQAKEKVNMVRDRFIEDLAKVHGGLNAKAAEKIKQSGIKVICLAVTSYPEDLEGWKEVQTTYKTAVNYVWLRERHADEARGGLAMIWWELDILPSAKPVKLVKPNL